VTLQPALAHDAFCRPLAADGRPLSYLCGHSLGLAPRAAAERVAHEMHRWATLGVRGHFEAADRGDTPWALASEPLRAPLARLVGASVGEVVAMNSLSVNLHLLLLSFFRPQGARSRVLLGRNAFPSDRLALESQCRLHGLDPAVCLVEAQATEGVSMTDAVLRELHRHGERVALVWLDAVDYTTGEVVDIGRVARAAQAAGARVGFDLAHAIGNLPLALSEDGVDFAVWCGYKYLNGGPGGLGGAYVHRRFHDDSQLQRLEGWWGQAASSRFAWGQQPREREAGAGAWQLSNPPVLAAAALAASLELFDRFPASTWRARSLALTALARDSIEALDRPPLRILTPSEPARRGAQLSLALPGQAVAMEHALLRHGVVCDARGADILRVSFCPLYNDADDVRALAQALEQLL